MKYRFVGSHTEIVGKPILDEFGQPIELSEDEAPMALAHGGPPVIPEADFERLGGDPRECRSFLAKAREAGNFKEGG